MRSKKAKQKIKFNKKEKQKTISHLFIKYQLLPNIFPY